MGIFDRDRWQEIFDTMRKHKLRTILTALGVFWGIFMLVFVVAMGNGLRNGVMQDFGSSATNVMYAWSNRTSMPYKGFQAGRRIRLEYDDILAIKREIKGVKRAEPRYSEGNYLISFADESDRYELRGELANMIDIENFVLPEGRYLNDGDLKNNRKVCVIGGRVKEVLFGEDSAVGQFINVNGVAFKVVGVMEPENIKPWTEDDMKCVTIPLTTMYASFVGEERIDYFAVQAEDNVAVSVLEQQVRSLLRARHSIHPDDPRGIGGWNKEKKFNQVQGLFTGILAFMWFVGIGTLLAGIIGVSNIMLIVVKERTKEIGIRKALGAPPKAIISMILTESIFITAISGYLGLIFGTFIIGGLAWAMKTFEIEADMFANPQVDMTVGLGAVIILIIAGLLAGLIPAMQAASVNPVVALKDE